MSFDIFLQCFRKGEPEPIPREIFDSIFAPHDTHPHVREKDPGYMAVEYPDGSGGCIYSGYDKEDSEHWSHMMFNHCGGRPIYLYTDPSVPAGLKGISYFEEARGVFIRSGAEIEPAIASG